MKQLWVLAGGNGAGKSTFYDRFLKPHGLSFVNADMIAKGLSDDTTPEVSLAAQEKAREVCQQKLEQGETFCFETVFSHESKVELIVHAKKLGYSVNLVFIHLSSSDLNKARVVQRVSSGGHDVPHDKIESRIPRTIENVAEAIKIVDQAVLLDNSLGEDPFKKVAVIKNGQIVECVDPMPEWGVELVKKL